MIARNLSLRMYKKDGATQSVIINGQKADFVIVHNIDQYTLEMYSRNDLVLQQADDLVGWHTAQLALAGLSDSGMPIETIYLSKEQSLYWQATNHLFDAAVFYGVAKKYARKRLTTQKRVSNLTGL